MLKRIITSIVALIVFFVVLTLPEECLVIAIGLVSFMMTYECMSAVKASKLVCTFSYISTFILYLGLILDIILDNNPLNYPISLVSIIITVLMFMSITVFLHGKVKYSDVLSSGFFVLYVVFSMSFIARLRLDYGLPAMLLVFVCAWLTDTGAYFTGCFLGKHKLIEHVSPKKTIEGSIGGIIVCIISCIVYKLVIVNLKMTFTGAEDITYIHIAIIGLVSSILSQLGDLVASAIKRDCDIKDYGWIFPGHGGFMDRFDSVMYIAPVIYLLLLI